MIIQQIQQYFIEYGKDYVKILGDHVALSGEALMIALVIGFPLGYLSYSKPKLRQAASFFTQGLRVIPSLGLEFILIPFIGVGRLPAIIALVFLAIPPILLNTIVGFNEVPQSLIETATGLGMTKWQKLYKVSLPLASPHILNGGLGTIIFTGLGLYRYDLLIIGGGSVALLSFISMILFDLLISRLPIEKHKKRSYEI